MASRRRKQLEEEENHERWLVSYADFITLLFAFFVVMYSVSSVNDGKYRVLSDSLNAVFEPPSLSLQPIQVGEPVRSLISPGEPAPAPVGEQPEELSARERLAEIEAERLALAGSTTRVSDAVELALREFVDQKLVAVRRDGNRVEIEMKAQMLFDSGRAHLSRTALTALATLAGVLEALPNRLMVEGHTDNQPIASREFPSNWELSAARAASVVHFLAREGIAPERMAAVGRGEYQPIADNTSETGRAGNRRVSVIVLGVEPGAADADGGVPWAEGPAVDVR